MKNWLKPILITALVLVLGACFFLIRGQAPERPTAAQSSSSVTVETTAAVSGKDTASQSPAVSGSGAPQDAKPSASVTADGLTDLTALRASVSESLSGLGSVWDVYVECLTDGSSISCSHKLPPDGRMVSASIIKIFVMGTVFDQISLGKVKESSVTADLRKMITVSDNDATNRLITALGGGDSAKGFKLVNKFAENLGCAGTQLNRLMLDWSQGLENYTTGKDCAKLLRLIDTGKCVSKDASKKMLALLKAQEKNEGLKWPIPKDVTVASKPGFISGVSVGDVGIVYSAKMTYIICIICNKPASDAAAMQKISDISELAYRFFNSGNKEPAQGTAPEQTAFVEVAGAIPSVYVNLKYSTASNFTHKVIYDFEKAYLRYGTVEKLMEVQKELSALGYSIEIWDAFRPVQAQFKLWEAYPDANYVADPTTGFSSHSRGNTLDITLVTLSGGKVDMPSDFDDFTALADRDYSDVTAAQAKNALLLEDVMKKHGFTPYAKEWWHYSDTDQYEVDKNFIPPD